MPHPTDDEIPIALHSVGAGLPAITTVSEAGGGGGTVGPLSAMDGAIEPYMDVFTGVSRSAASTTRLDLRSTKAAISSSKRTR
ncbi:MAG: hypothetical protein V4751_12465 [Pseudomonadota bacterium]